MTDFIPAIIGNVLNSNLPQVLQSTDLQAYQTSVKRCTEAGNSLIQKIESNGGLDDSLDQLADKYIKASSATVRKLNGIRAPLTSCFDEIRKMFTESEKSIAPSQPGSPACQLQELRNAFARKKDAEKNERRRLEQERIRMEAAANTYRISCVQAIADAFSRQLEGFECYASKKVDELSKADEAETLHKIIDVSSNSMIQDVDMLPIKLPHEPLLASEYKERIFNEVYKERTPELIKQLSTDINNMVVRAHARIREKALLLEQSSASAEAGKKLEALAAQPLLPEDERSSMAEQAKTEAEVKQKAAEAETLFEIAGAEKAVEAEYMPKTKSRLVCRPLNAEGYAEVFALWWAGEGKHLDECELQKVFKKQLTYANKMANSAKAEKIASSNVEYVNEIKAR